MKILLQNMQDFSEAPCLPQGLYLGYCPSEARARIVSRGEGGAAALPQNPWCGTQHFSAIPPLPRLPDTVLSCAVSAGHKLVRLIEPY